MCLLGIYFESICCCVSWLLLQVFSAWIILAKCSTGYVTPKSHSTPQRSWPRIYLLGGYVEFNPSTTVEVINTIIHVNDVLMIIRIMMNMGISVGLSYPKAGYNIIKVVINLQWNLHVILLVVHATGHPIRKPIAIRPVPIVPPPSPDLPAGPHGTSKPSSSVALTD